MELIKETKVWRVYDESKAIEMINQYKNEIADYTVTKSGYVTRTKKQKGEIVETWYVVTIEFSYEV